MICYTAGMWNCLRNRRRAKRLAELRAERRRRAAEQRRSKLYHQAWDLYDQMPSGPDKRTMNFVLHFRCDSVDSYTAVIEVMQQYLGVDSDGS